MPLSLYAGPPRQGKSYEVVNFVMVPAFRAGRTIVTNVRGIDPKYWEDTLEPIPGRQLGKIVVVNDAYLQDDTNYPAYSDTGVVQPGNIPDGSLVVIDEAYTVFGTEKGMVTKRMLKWVMTHGQFTDADGVCTDIVMIAQDMMLLLPKVRNVAEAVYWVRNFRFIHKGLSMRYRVTGYTSWRMNGQPMTTARKRYSLDGFKLYKSTTHADGKGKMATTYAGASAASPKFFLMVGLSVVAMLYGGYSSYRTFAKPAPEPLAAAAGSPQKPDCHESGILFDVSGRRALVKGEWRNATLAPLSDDGRVGYDVGHCVFRFGGGPDRRPSAFANGG